MIGEAQAAALDASQLLEAEGFLAVAIRAAPAPCRTAPQRLALLVQRRASRRRHRAWSENSCASRILGNR